MGDCTIPAVMVGLESRLGATGKSASRSHRGASPHPLVSVVASQPLQGGGSLHRAYSASPLSNSLSNSLLSPIALRTVHHLPGRYRRSYFLVVEVEDALEMGPGRWIVLPEGCGLRLWADLFGVRSQVTAKNHLSYLERAGLIEVDWGARSARVEERRAVRVRRVIPVPKEISRRAMSDQTVQRRLRRSLWG